MNHLRRFSGSSESHKHEITCPFEITSDSSLIGKDSILIISWNHLVHLAPGENPKVGSFHQSTEHEKYDTAIYFAPSTLLHLLYILVVQIKSSLWLDVLLKRPKIHQRS